MLAVHGLGITRAVTIAGLVFRGLLGLAIIALLVLLIIWLIRVISHRGKMGEGHAGHDPKQIAKERYAKGEISQAEYKKLIDDLKD